MFNLENASRKHTLHSVRVLTLMNFVVGIAAYYGWMSTAQNIVAHTPFFINISASLLFFILTFIFPGLSLLALIAITLISYLLAANVEAVVNLTMAISGLSYQPFLTSKITALAVAVVALTPTYLGFLIIALCTLFPVLEYYFLIPQEFRQNIQRPEPYATFFYTFIAAVILIFRSKMNKIERQLISAKHEQEAAEKRLKLVMALRDLSNSPIQVIEFVSELLHSEHKEAEYLADRLDSSLSELKELNKTLLKYDTTKTDSDVSFDATKTVKEIMG